jgi:nucleoid-associated protein YgaU
MSGAGLENPTINRLRAPPANLSSQPTARIAAINNDRFSAQPAPQPISQNPTPTYDYPPRTSPTSDYTPHASAQSDFNQRDSGSGVITASVPAGIQRNGDQYTTGPNDSFWIISEKAYGSGGYFKALFELNRKRTKDSEDLKVGDVLTVPDEAVIRRMYPDLCPKPRKPTAGTQQRMLSASNRLQGTGRVYTVVDGDTLFEIARHELGRPARWAEIYELNRDVVGDDFDYLRPGTELILPDHPNGPADSHSSNTAIRQPDSLYPR